MNFNVVVTCAVTGAGDTKDKNPHVPITPDHIAKSAIDAAKAGASVVHIHVRDPKTGKGSRDPKLFYEVVTKIRASNTDVVINLTAGMGGDWVPDPQNLSMPGDGTDMIGPQERLQHVEECLPEICTLDCGTFNFGNTEYVSVNTPNTLREMAKQIESFEVKPEIKWYIACSGR